MMQRIAELAAVLVGVGAALAALIVRWMAEGILRPPRMTDGKAVYVLKRLSPGDLGMRFSNEHFTVRDTAASSGAKIDLAAWWIEAAAPSDRCVVLIHGYADAKVGAIGWAPMWRGLGFHILAIDLRAHGESGGRDCTAGYFERHDTSELLNQLRLIRPEQTRRLVLFGASMGAAVALATAALREDIAGVVLDSPYMDYAWAVHTHLSLIGLPSRLLATAAIKLAQLESGARFDEVRPIDLLERVQCPIMLVRGEAEEFLGPAERQRLIAAMRRRAEGLARRGADLEWMVPAAGHLGALHADPDGYARRLREFTDRL
jgi:pimeloyl-ACP methyl ester carboxylesterase